MNTICLFTCNATLAELRVALHSPLVVRISCSAVTLLVDTYMGQRNNKTSSALLTNLPGRPAYYHQLAAVPSSCLDISDVSDFSSLRKMQKA